MVSVSGQKYKTSTQSINDEGINDFEIMIRFSNKKAGDNYFKQIQNEIKEK